MYHQINDDQALQPLTFEELMDMLMLGVSRSSSDTRGIEPITPEDLTLEGFFRL